MSTQAFGFIRARNGVALRAGPAREPAFNVVTDQADMHKAPEGSAEHLREILHGSVNEELQSLEIAAQNLVDFPGESWETRMSLARHCWDETRHASMFFRRLLEVGGRKGEFPVINQEWGVVCTFDSLEGRVAVLNRVFEGGSLDVLKESAEFWGARGDDRTAAIMEAVMVDEIHHAHFGNQWLEQLRASEPKRLLKAIAAMSRLRTLARELAPPEHVKEHPIPVNEDDRRRAGF